MSKPDSPLGEWLTEPGGVAERLRAIRLRAGLTGYQLADVQGWPQSKVSKIENGRQVPSVADIRAWLDACGGATQAEDLIDQLEQVSARHQDWRRRLRQGMPTVQAGYNDLVRELSVYRCFTADVVPGLLQTAEYARYPLGEGVVLHGARADDLDAAVATRMQRQQYLYDQGKRFEFILGEPVLRWLICPPAVMLGQLDRLLAVVSGLSNVRFGILPLGQRLSLCPGNTFDVFDDVAYVETYVGETVHTGAEAATYHQVMDRLWADAVTGEGARKLITRAVDEVRQLAETEPEPDSR